MCEYHIRTMMHAVQIKEVALIHGEGSLAGELKHGPLALVDASLPVIVFATQGQMYRKMVSVLQQLKARSARVIVVCSEGDREIGELLSSSRRASHNGKSALQTSENGHPSNDGGHAQPQLADEVLEVPLIEESLQSVVNAVPLQLLAYHLTVLRGLNVDQPRNLAKSVTVTED